MLSKITFIKPKSFISSKKNNKNNSLRGRHSEVYEKFIFNVD